MSYLVFAGDDYYPRGGWDDFKADFCSLETAKIECAAFDGSSFSSFARHDWAHIVHDGKIVSRWIEGKEQELT